MGKRWEISGLPLAMGKESLLDFVSGWHVTPLHTFKQGFSRTWIVRAATDPVEKIIAHDFGVAVVKEAVAKPRVVATERFQAPVRSASAFMRQTASNYPKSWVVVVFWKFESDKGQHSEQIGFGWRDRIFNGFSSSPHATCGFHSRASRTTQP